MDALVNVRPTLGAGLLPVSAGSPLGPRSRDEGLPAFTGIDEMPQLYLAGDQGLAVIGLTCCIEGLPP